ncbi:MAG: prepilin-type N-terminal cleavage/methylation domain-containing protein [Phycisphaerae bacterium]|nr:prepilin-type N-terminal cleavage/methylation domain-containing protein [Phycisphaerae bacterium]
MLLPTSNRSANTSPRAAGAGRFLRRAASSAATVRGAGVRRSVEAYGPAGAGPVVTRGFTITELLVAVTILAVTIVAVSEIFNISSEAASRTTAHTEIMAASAAVQQRLTDALAHIEPGLLIIESPPPTGLRGDVPFGREYFRLRHDRLVFIASGSPGEFQSFTDPRRGTPEDPDETPATGTQALVYFGPGIPLFDTGDLRPRPFDDDAYSLSGCEWVFANRSILFLLDPPSSLPPDWNPPDMGVFTGGGGMLLGGDLYEDYREGQMDVVVSDETYKADAATLVNLVLGKDISVELSSNPTIAALWEPNWCPTSATLDDPGSRDYYTHSGFAFQHGLADFRIEWTDGRRVDPANGDYRTRWFGLRPDPASSAQLGSPIDYLPVLREQYTDDTTVAEAKAFGMVGDDGANLIEWSDPPVGGGSANDARYRAIWRGDTWQFRPKALRFTYRIYDANHRLKHTTEVDLDEDGDPDPDGDATYDVARFGMEFSIVVPLP